MGENCEFCVGEKLPSVMGRQWSLHWKVWRADVRNICQAWCHSMEPDEAEVSSSPTFLWLTLREQLWILQLCWGHVSPEDPRLLTHLQNLQLDCIGKDNISSLSLVISKQLMLHLHFGQREKLLLLKIDCICFETLQRRVHACTFALGTSGCHFKSNEGKWTFHIPLIFSHRATVKLEQISCASIFTSWARGDAEALKPTLDFSAVKARWKLRTQEGGEGLELWSLIVHVSGEKKGGRKNGK